MFKEINNQIILLEKFSDRVFSTKHPAIKKRMNYLSNVNYKVYAHKDASFNKSKSIFTIITIAYDTNLDYIKESVNSFCKQTYDNTEIIIVNNGASGVVGDFLWESFINNKNAKLIVSPNNLFDFEASDFEDPYTNWCNAALFCSTGDYIFGISYDDSISADYVERMVNLFEENPNCTSVAPLVVSVNEFSEITAGRSAILKRNNNRERYTNGITLAQSFMRGGGMIGFPGGLLAHKSDIVLQFGGYDKLSDLSQLFRFAITGDSGYDPEAILYWRYHSNQTNKIMTKMGLIFYKDNSDYSELYGLYKFHVKFAGTDFANEFAKYLNERVIKMPINCYCNSFVTYGLISGLAALKRIFAECPPTIIVKALLISPLLSVKRLQYLFIYLPRDFLIEHLPESIKYFYRKVKSGLNYR